MSIVVSAIASRVFPLLSRLPSFLCFNTLDVLDSEGASLY